MSPTLLAGTRSLRHVAAARDRGRLFDAAATVVAVLVLGGPALFTENGFSYDFTNHLWLVWVQQHAIATHLTPTYFVNAAPVGVYYPVFAFYGGTLYVLTGTLAAVLAGRTVIAFVGVSLLAIAAAYYGCVWLMRQLGSRSWMAHAPAITFTASAYYVTNLYGRGAWPEVVATSMLPLLLASAVCLARATRVRAGPAVVFVLSTLIFTGSHNATLLLGTLFIVAVAVGIRLATRVPLVPGGWRRVGLMAFLFVAAAALNAWFLLPDVVNASQIALAKALIPPWSASSFFNTPAVLFDPFRHVPNQSTTPALFVQAPVWFLVWALAVFAVLRARVAPAVRRAAGAIAVVLALVLLAIMVDPVWTALPKLLRDVQFPFRLNTYVALACAGLVALAVLAVERDGHPARGWQIALGAVAAISVGLCIWQLWVPQTLTSQAYANRHAALRSLNQAPRTWYDQGYYDHGAGQLLAPRTALAIDPRTITADNQSLVVRPPAGAPPFATNIAAGPYVLKVGGGVRSIGRTAAGLRVLARVGGGAGPVTVTFSSETASVVAGQVLTLIAFLVLVIFGAEALRRRVRGP